MITLEVAKIDILIEEGNPTCLVISKYTIVFKNADGLKVQG